MRGLRPACSLIILGSTLVVVDPTYSEPRIELSWNACDPVETVHPVLGADRNAHLFISLDGVSGTITAVLVQIAIHTQSFACGCSGADGATVPPDWSFEPGGCQGPERVMSTFGPIDGACLQPLSAPSFIRQTTSRDTSYCLPSSCGTAHEVVTLEAMASQSWFVSPQTRSTIWRVDFDLSSSCSYSSGECCPAGEPIWLAATGAAILEGGSKLELAGSEVTYSANAVPATPTSWGRLKVNYR